MTTTSAATTRSMGGSGPRWQTRCIVGTTLHPHVLWQRTAPRPHVWWRRGSDARTWAKKSPPALCTKFYFPLSGFSVPSTLAIQKNIFFGTIYRILNPTNLAVTSWDFSCFLPPGLYVRDLFKIDTRAPLAMVSQHLSLLCCQVKWLLYSPGITTVAIFMTKSPPSQHHVISQ